MQRSIYLKPIALWCASIAAVVALSALFGTQVIYPERNDLDDNTRDKQGSAELLGTPQDEGWMRRQTITDSGVVQHPPSIDTTPLSVEERIIDNLQQANDQLLDHVDSRKTKAGNLETDLELLQALAQNPDKPGSESTQLEQERKRVSERIERLLAAGGRWQELHDEEKQMVAYAAIEGYLEIMRRSRLGMSEGLKKQVITSLMPGYSECLGDGLPFVAATHSERKRLLEYLQSHDPVLLRYGHMREDLEYITQECFSDLVMRINRILNTG